MGRFASPMSTRPRTDRARRRVSFFAESLESRQLLSVAAAVHPAIAPAVNVPAAFGPVVGSPAANAGAGESAFGSTVVNVSLPVATITIVEGQISHGFTEVIEIVEGPVASTGFGATAPETSGGSSSTTGTSTSALTPTSTQTTSTTAITPLAATLVTTPGAANRGLIVAVVTPQPIVAPNLSPSTLPATTQAVLATATQEEQPIGPPMLGQGFESGQTQGVDPRFDKPLVAPTPATPPEFQLPAIDFIEPRRPAAENPPVGQPVQPAEPPAPAAPARDPEPVDLRPDDPAAFADRARSPESPILPPTQDARAEAPSWSMAAVVGTAAIAGGGYHLVLGRSNRFNQRWIPARRSSRRKSFAS